jgi:hypothetical protein
MKILIFFIAFSLYANIEDHFKKIEGLAYSVSIENVDFTYLINLDSRYERLIQSREALLPYGIWPQRFSGIYGWHLPYQTYDEVGVKFMPGMWTGIENALYLVRDGYFIFVKLGEEFYDKTVFSSWLTPGALGCTLSHLSVLQDAYDQNYETIWILEDDFNILQNPHFLSSKIETLDSLVGRDGWDVLYTDPDYLFGLDETKDLQSQIPMKWRPDMPEFDLTSLLEHTPVGDDFFKIGSRNRTHSMILCRSGIEKILDFYKKRHIFLPYDHELAFIPNLRLFVLKEPIVDNIETCSDTKDRHF